MKTRTTVHAGDLFGCLTTLDGDPQIGAARKRYAVRCECGFEYEVSRSHLLSCPVRCRMCRGKIYSKMMAEKRQQLIGTVINGFRSIEDVSPRTNDRIDKALFLVECIRCGDRTVKPLGNMKVKNGEICGACPPSYEFEVNDGIATGHLPDGTVFKIDAADIPLVEKYFWYVNGGGYLFHRDKQTQEPIRMHRYLLGLEMGDGTVVDHINRDKLDNRRSNLRVVTQTENCLNREMRCDNTTGYMGVSRDSRTGRYTAAITRNNRPIRLGSSADPIEAAQMYNIAARMLFGEYVGYLNNVPDAETELVKRIERKVKPILSALIETATEAVFNFAT